MVRWNWIRIASLVKLGWAQIHYLNEPIWTFYLRIIKNQEKKSIFNRQQTALMWTWFLASNDSTEGQIYYRQCIHFNGRYIEKKLHSKSVLGFDSSEEITHFNNHDILDKNMRFADCIKKLWDDMTRKMEIL